MDESFLNGRVILKPGDCREILKQLTDNSIDAVTTDPPYALVSIGKRLGKDGAYARASAGFMGQCYHPMTEVMTSNGWKRITDVRAGEVVATLDVVTRSIEYQPVKQVHAYPFDGDLVHIRHRSAEQVVTPNHKVVASFDGGKTLKLVQPPELHRTFHLFAQGEPIIGKVDESVTLTIQRPYGISGETVTETKSFDAAALFYFIGLFIGDGFTTNRADDHPANDFFGLSVKKTRKLDCIRAALLSLNIKFTETANSDRLVTFYCYDFVLLYTLKSLGTATMKFIPAWVFDYDSSLLEKLYQGLMDTDGCRQGGNRFGEKQDAYYTSSARLADDFQRLCLHTGRSAISVFKPGGHTRAIRGRVFTCSDAWTLCALQPGKRLWARREDNVVSYPYTGDVFCIGVERHHTLYTRFNGKPVWSGNSWDTGETAFAVEFWEECFRVLKPGGHVVAFSGTRTYHRLAVAIEDAGFEIRDQLAWVYGVGFAKSHAVDLGMWKRVINCQSKESAPLVVQVSTFTHATCGVAKEHIAVALAVILPEGGPALIMRTGKAGDTPAVTVMSLSESERTAISLSTGWSWPTQSVESFDPRSMYTTETASKQITDPEIWKLLTSQTMQEYTPCSVTLQNGWAWPAVTVASSSSEENTNKSAIPILTALAPATWNPVAQAKGKGSGLKPAWEPICLARKPLIGTLVENALEHGTGAINIDGCRVGVDESEIVQDDGQRVTTTAHEGYLRPGASMFNTGKAAKRSGPSNSQGRFPANLMHDGSDEVVAAFPGEGDKSASRFFYSSKASKHDRAGSKHPTVKPVALMQWLIRLVCPKGGTVIDPFSGSGTTGAAAYLEGVNAILCEREEEYLSDIRSRLNALDATDKKSEHDLFD